MGLYRAASGGVAGMVAVCLLFLTGVAESEPGWILEEITSTMAQIKSTELVLDSADRPHVAYIVGSKVVYAVRESGEWAIDTLVSAGASSSSIDLFSSDLPAIAYVESFSPCHVKFMYYDGIAWHTESVGLVQSGNQEVSLVIDCEDVPHILHHYFTYMNPYNAVTRIYYHTREPAGWEYELVLAYGTIEEGTVEHTDLAFTPPGSGNQPRVTYGMAFGGGTKALDYVWPDQRPEYWNRLTITSWHDMDYENSLDVDPNGLSHCTYRRYSKLYYASGNTSGFTYGLVDGENGVAEYSDVRGDSQSVPHIVYTTHYSLRYATKPSYWVIESIGPPSGPTRDPSICLDSDDVPHVAWIANGTINSILYAWYDDPSGVSEPGHAPGPSLLFRGVYPNPQRGTALAEFTLTEPASVSHGIFTIDGRLVWRDDCQYPAGVCSITLPHLESGVYIYRMQAMDQVESRRFTVVD